MTTYRSCGLRAAPRRQRRGLALILACSVATAAAAQLGDDLGELRLGDIARTEPAEPGAALDLLSFLPMRAGDSWSYRDPATEATVVRYASEEDETSIEDQPLRLVRIDSSDGDYRVEARGAGVGLLWLQEAVLGGGLLDYTGGLHLLPAEIETGAAYASSTDYSVTVDDESVETGTVTSRVQVGALRSVRVGDELLDDCLELRVELRYRSTEGDEQDSQVTLVFARGVGLVGESGAATIAPALRTTLTPRRLDLVEAAVGGTLVPRGADRRPEIPGADLLAEPPPG